MPSFLDNQTVGVTTAPLGMRKANITDFEMFTVCHLMHFSEHFVSILSQILLKLSYALLNKEKSLNYFGKN